MFARFARTAPAATFFLVLTTATAFALGPTPRVIPSASVAAAARTPSPSWSSAPSAAPTPDFSSIPFPAASPTMDAGWIPAPGTAAYDPNAPVPQPSCPPEAPGSLVYFPPSGDRGSPGSPLRPTQGVHVASGRRAVRPVRRTTTFAPPGAAVAPKEGQSIQVPGLRAEGLFVFGRCSSGPSRVGGSAGRSA